MLWKVVIFKRVVFVRTRFLLKSSTKMEEATKDSGAEIHFILSQWSVTEASCCHLVTYKSCLTHLQPHGLQPARLLCPQDFPGKNTGMGCHFSNPGVPHCRQILYCLSHRGSPLKSHTLKPKPHCDGMGRWSLHEWDQCPFTEGPLTLNLMFSCPFLCVRTEGEGNHL